MKQIVFSFGVLCFLLVGCKNKAQDPLPVEIWSHNCMELAPFEDGYRLDGICCAYFLMPDLKINQERSYKVMGSYHSFTGAGFSSTPVEITGDLSPDNATLTFSYSINGQKETINLVPGKAIMLCQCGCK